MMINEIWEKALEDPAVIISIISLLISFIALVFTAINVFTASRALKISLRAEEGRSPNLFPRLLEGFAKRSEGFKIYAFYVSMDNRSDNSRRVGSILNPKLAHYRF